MKQMHLPLIPAEAGIQTESTETSLSLLGPRFRGDERESSLHQALIFFMSGS